MSTEHVPLNLDLVTSPASAAHVFSGEIEITMAPHPILWSSCLCCFSVSVSSSPQSHCDSNWAKAWKALTAVLAHYRHPIKIQERSGHYPHPHEIIVTTGISERVLPAQCPAYSKCLINPSRWCSVVITASSFSKALTSIFHTLSQHVQLNSVFFVKPTTAVSSLWEEGLF